jgi:hypothetical protein
LIIINFLAKCQKIAYVSDMPKNVTQAVLAEASQLHEGALISAKGLLHLGKRAAVDQALTRLVHRKELMRTGHGLYVRPIKTKFGVRAPAPEKVVQEIARTHAEIIAKHGAAEANALGLTTQVPIKSVFWTTGKSRKLKLGSESVELKNAPLWLLQQSRAGEAIRALYWIGKPRVAAALTMLKSKLPQQTVEEIVALRPALPAWLSKSISEELVPRG